MCPPLASLPSSRIWISGLPLHNEDAQTRSPVPPCPGGQVGEGVGPLLMLHEGYSVGLWC
jgi:hypothetical protein